jgi:hypothetical protein
MSNPCLLGLPVVLFLTGCVSPKGPGNSNSSGAVLQEIPQVEPGWREVPVRYTSFRGREIEHPSGKWSVSFEDDALEFITPKGPQAPVGFSWYPEEGGADAASVRAYVRGGETLLRLIGTSDFLDEESRFRFEDGMLKDVVKYRLPGPGQGEDYPGTPVPPEDRVRRGSF